MPTSAPETTQAPVSEFPRSGVSRMGDPCTIPSPEPAPSTLAVVEPPGDIKVLHSECQLSSGPQPLAKDQPEGRDSPPASRILRAVGSFLIEQWNLLTMGLLILLAYFFPYVGTTGGAIRAEYTISWGAVAVIFLIAGLSLSPAALLKGIPHWRAHLVSNIFSFLVSPAIMFAFATAGQGAHLDFYVLAGMIVTGTMPTTIASNVTCTLNAKGSTELASIEVVLGNVLGTFLTPLLAQMFLSSPRWSAAAPGASGSVTAIYIRMAKQLSATLFAPLIVGLIIQRVFPRPVARVRAVLHLNKVASFMTTLCVWHNFCKAFYSGAFYTTSHATIIYLCFMCFATYMLLTALVLGVLRVPGAQSRAAQWWRFSKRDTIALCFCGPAKGVAVGSPLIAILYARVPLNMQAKLALALLIYNGEQVAVGQLVVPVLRWWARDEIDLERREKDQVDSSNGTATTTSAAAWEDVDKGGECRMEVGAGDLDIEMSSFEGIRARRLSAVGAK